MAYQRATLVFATAAGVIVGSSASFGVLRSITSKELGVVGSDSVTGRNSGKGEKIV